MTPFCHVLETIVTSENASNNWTVEGTCHGAISAKGLGNHFQNTSHLYTIKDIRSIQIVNMWPNVALHALTHLITSFTLFNKTTVPFLLRITFGAAGKQCAPITYGAFASFASNYGETGCYSYIAKRLGKRLNHYEQFQFQTDQPIK